MNKNHKKILHIIAPVSFGGGETLLLTLLKEKVQNVDEEILLIYSSPKFEQALKAENIKYYVLTNINLGNGVSRKKTFIYALKSIVYESKLKKIVVSGKYDVIHAHGFPASIMAAILPKRIKKVYTHHTRRMKANKLEQLIFTMVYNRFDVKTGVSQSVCDSMNLAFPKIKNKFQTIYNCINPIFFENVLDKITLNEMIEFVYPARLVSFKNHRFIVDTLDNIPKNIVDKIKIIFIGDGPERENIQNEVKKRGLEKHVELLGTKNPDDIVLILDQCDFGITASLAEGFGIGAVECMARGLPVVAIKNGTIEEIIGDGGYCSESNDFANTIIQAIEDGNQLKRNNAIERSKDFNVQKIKREYVEIYTNV